MGFMISKYLRSLTIGDLILVLLCLIVAAAFFKAQYSKPQKVYVYKDDHLQGSYELNKDRIIEIDEHVTIEIAYGKARIAKSDCPYKRCVKQGFSNKMPIICMPNRIMLQFKNAEDEHILILY